MKKIIGFYRKCDFITMGGTVFAFCGMLLLAKDHYTYAVLFLIFAGLCDAFDGAVARKLKSNDMQKVYGGQLDSLSDVICFGVYPALITASLTTSFFAYAICVFYTLCGLIRLAYFNTLDVTKKSKKGIFVGIPITTVAVAFPLIYLITIIIDFEMLKIVLPVLLLILGLLFIIRVEYPKLNVPKIINCVLNKYVIDLIVFPWLIIIGTNIVYLLNDYKILESFSILIRLIINKFPAYLLSYVILVVVYLILTSIFKKSKVTKILLIVVFSILILISDIKLGIMGNPVEFSDVNYLNPDNISMMGNSTSSIGLWVIISIVKVVVFVAICCATLFKNVQIKIEKVINRIIIPVVFVVLGVTFFALIIKNNTVVMKKIFNKGQSDVTKYISIRDMYDEYGYCQGFILNALSKRYSEPEGYDKIAVNKLLNTYDNKEETSWKKANVVFILSESFSNLNNISNTQFENDIMKNINSYRDDEDKMVFDLIVPTYGGVSVNTEFEILTGGSISFFPAGFIPWTQYYNDHNGKTAPNLIKEFNNNNYETMYLTPWGQESYKSEYVYSLFGTDRKIYHDTIGGYPKGTYYSDECLTDAIYKELSTTSDGNYKFIMAASAQNHYPYGKGKYTEYDVKIKNTSLKGEDQDIILNYAQGIYDADKELNRLYEMIQTIDTPTIIVFYGDHLPYTVNSNGGDPYLSDIYFNTDNSKLNIVRMYTTLAVVLSNYDISMESVDGMNANYLGAYVLNKMDLKISNYFKYVADMQTKTPMFNKETIIVDDYLYDYEEDKKDSELLKNYNYVQYRMLYD